MKSDSKKLKLEEYQIRCGDVLKQMHALADESIHCIITPSLLAEARLWLQAAVGQ